MAATSTNPGLQGQAAEIKHLAVHRVPLDAPWEWMGAGWNDLLRAPATSLIYGAVFTLIAWAITFGLNELGLGSIILMLAGGFMLLGPLFAAGLYAMSRGYDRNEKLSFSQSLSAARHPKGQFGFFAVVLMLAFLAWVQIAFLLLMLFLGGSTVVNSSEFVSMLLFQPTGQALLVTGTLVGAIIATIVFSISVVAAPLLFDRDVSALSAMATSVRAVKTNKGAMVLWAAIIAGTMVLGLATLFLGLVVAFPLIGHSTWHAMRDLVDGHRPQH